MTLNRKRILVAGATGYLGGFVMKMEIGIKKEVLKNDV